MSEVPATIVDDASDHPGTPGALDFCATTDGEAAGFAFVCPCGCGRMGYLPVNGTGRPGPSWEWDGNREAPTLTPSVQFVGGCAWHGYLTAGVWRSC